MARAKKPRRRVRFTIESRLENVPLVGMSVNRLCGLIPLSEIDACRMELCVVEAVNNSILHAYEKKAGGEVDVVFSLFSDRLVIQVLDSGTPMSESRVRDRGLSSLDHNTISIRDIPESGRGIGIIQSIMDDVSYGTDSGKNCLTMVKKIAPSKKMES